MTSHQPLRIHHWKFLRLATGRRLMVTQDWWETFLKDRENIPLTSSSTTGLLSRSRGSGTDGLVRETQTA